MISLLLLSALSVSAHAEDAPAPSAVESMFYAQPFTLAVNHPWTWAADRQGITAGVLVAVRANPDLARPRQLASPVLYADGSPVERMNGGYPSGCVVAIIPGTPDLSALRLYFGDAALPERLTREDGERALASAVQAGVTTLGPMARDIALAPVALPDITAVYRLAAPLVTACSPEEAHLAEGWLTLPE